MTVRQLQFCTLRLLYIHIYTAAITRLFEQPGKTRMSQNKKRSGGEVNPVLGLLSPSANWDRADRHLLSYRNKTGLVCAAFSELKKPNFVVAPRWFHVADVLSPVRSGGCFCS